jgi:membrane associated rhomboid family serine protease/DNA-directed RNA polymerase subunit RPC12/RpoP
VSQVEFGVVCSNCGEEVSAYVTECPYCGTRLRKRAPKLERQGDELAPRETRRQRRRRERAERRERMEGYRAIVGEGERPYAVMAAVAVGIAGVLIQRAATLPITDLGAIVGTNDVEAWRYLAAPFAYPDVTYLFACSLGIVIFGSAVEARLGTVPTLILIIACGSLGMLAAVGIEDALGDGGSVLLAAGGNGIALGLLTTWAVLKAYELRADPDQEVEVIGAAVAAAVLIMLPLVEDFANVFVGLSGALVGAACGLAAVLARREKRPG